MSKIRLTLTREGHESILRQGVYKTFTNFTVTDDLNRYDIVTEANLTKTLNGGLRNLVQATPTCEYATTKPINKRKPTIEETKKATQRLDWSISRLDDCDTTYTGANAKILVNLRTWFNYIQAQEGPSNYNYNKKIQLSLTDNIKAIQKVLNASTMEYDQVATFDNLDISYTMDSLESMMKYKNINSYIMTIEGGKKVLSTTTDQRRWSPLLLVADTEEGQSGSGDNWKLGLGVISHGYACILADSTDRVFRKNNFYSISEIEKMSRDELNKKFRAFRPAVITSMTNSNDDLYVLDDIEGKYAEGVDMLPTYTQRYKNSNGQYLSTGLINKAVNFIQTNFTESTTTPGLYERRIKMRIGNKTVNNTTYEDKSILGGNIEFILRWDGSGVDNDINNAVQWI